jgi:hypothetical protein
MTQYAILVTGAREWTNRELILDTLKDYSGNDVILIHGACSGVDQTAGSVAVELSFVVETYPAEWSKYGKVAGPVRNQQMVNRLLEHQKGGRKIVAFAFHNCIDESKGTKNCVNLLKKAGVNYTLIHE